MWQWPEVETVVVQGSGSAGSGDAMDFAIEAGEEAAGGAPWGEGVLKLSSRVSKTQNITRYKYKYSHSLLAADKRATFPSDKSTQ